MWSFLKKSLNKRFSEVLFLTELNESVIFNDFCGNKIYFEWLFLKLQEERAKIRLNKLRRVASKLGETYFNKFEHARIIIYILSNSPQQSLNLCSLVVFLLQSFT